MTVVAPKTTPIPKTNVQATAVLKRLASQDGFIEGPNNDNPYGKAMGYNHQPYCCYFVSWGFSCEHLLSLINQTPHGYYNAAEFEQFAHDMKRTVPVSQIKLGDILLYGEKGGKPYHTGFAASSIVPKVNLFPAWEANTSADHNPTGSQANGDGVHLRHRSPLWVLTVYRPPYTS